VSEGFQKFRLPCPSCGGGVRTVARFAPENPRSEGYASERCWDCDGKGWLVLGSGEWQRGRGPKPAAPSGPDATPE
jgi:hypothetical protein